MTTDASLGAGHTKMNSTRSMHSRPMSSGGDPDINKYKESVTDARLAFTRGTAGLCQLSLGRTGTRA